MKKNFLLLMGITVFWLFVAFLSISQSYISSRVRGYDLEWGLTFARNIGWIVWALLTPLAIEVARRFPFDRKNLVSFLFKILFVGLGFAILHFWVEFGIKYLIWVIFIDPNPDMVNEFYSAFFYRYHMNFIIFLFIAGSAYTVNYFNQSKNLEVATSRLQAQLATAQITALKQQLHPHFLFNVHHSIIGLVLNNDNETAIKMLTQLSDLLRITLDLGDVATIPLRQELDILKLYLNIHQIRMGNRLQVKYQIDKHLWDEKIPAFILQPIVENAIKHGIEPFARQGHIWIKAYESDQKLYLEVQDDGPGLKEAESHENGNGIGLKNSKERLRQMYGDVASMKLMNTNPGCKVQISLPLTIVSLEAKA
ncbi:MAG: histidine kinase [Saprospiraceae bacterium]|nr:histidine kinase [Saprospiraceae bacterium]